MRSLSMTITALAMTLPLASITLPALIALVAANAGAASSTNSQVRTRTLRIPRPRFFELFRDVLHERVRSDHARERAETENPALKRAIQAHLEGQPQAVRPMVAKLLRRVPFAGAHVIGDCRLKLDFHVFRRSGVYAERVRKGFVGQFFNRREASLEQREVLDSLDGERADLDIFRHIRQEIQAGLRVGQPIRMNQIG